MDSRKEEREARIGKKEKGDERTAKEKNRERRGGVGFDQEKPEKKNKRLRESFKTGGWNQREKERDVSTREQRGVKKKKVYGEFGGELGGNGGE